MIKFIIIVLLVAGLGVFYISNKSISTHQTVENNTVDNVVKYDNQAAIKGEGHYTYWTITDEIYKKLKAQKPKTKISLHFAESSKPLGMNKKCLDYIKLNGEMLNVGEAAPLYFCQYYKSK